MAQVTNGSLKITTSSGIFKTIYCNGSYALLFVKRRLSFEFEISGSFF